MTGTSVSHDAATHLDQKVLLELVGSLLVSLTLGVVLDQGVDVKAQVAHLVTQLFAGLSPARPPEHVLVRTIDM